MDGTEHEPTTADDEGHRSGHEDKPISFDFKLRLGSRESTAALAGRATGELVQLQAIDWDSFTGLRTESEPREYKTDSELQSIIVELANQIAAPETGSSRAVDGGGSTIHVSATAHVLDDRRAEPVVAPPADVPADRPQPVEVPAIVELTHDAPSAELATMAPVASAPAPVVPAPPVVTAAAVPEPVVAEPVAAEPAVASPAAAAPVAAELAPPVSASVAPAEVAPVVPEIAPPAVKMVTGAEALAVAASTAAPAAPAPAAPVLQLARIERRPGAERPSSPVDFHALLGQAGLQSAPAKKRKKRHPFRALFKLVVVLGLIGGGLYFGKKYVLDMRWDGDVKASAEAVAEERGLDWDKALEVEELELDEYSAHLAANVFGAEAVADPSALEAQWRAMGLLSGEVDLEEAASLAATVRPAYYDPADGKIYTFVDAPRDQAEFYLHVALGEALLDQHFDWSTEIESLDPSARAGVLALVQGDAHDIAVESLGLSLDEVNALDDGAAESVVDHDITIAWLGAYPVHLALGPGRATGELFISNVLPEQSDRDDVVSTVVDSDAAVLDGTRTLSSRPASIAGSGEQAGLLYWYEVLAGRLPQSEAWNAAVAWNGDRTELVDVADGRCVSATIATVDEAGRQRLLGALQQWAAAGPVESLATVTAVDPDRIEVRSCDPGAAATTVVNVAHVPWGDAAFELATASDYDLLEDEDARICTVSAVRGFGVIRLVEADDRAGFEQALADIATTCATA